MTRYSSEDGGRGNRGDTSQGANSICGVCGAYGGYKISEVQTLGERLGRAVSVGANKKMDGVP